MRSNIDESNHEAGSYKMVIYLCARSRSKIYNINEDEEPHEHTSSSEQIFEDRIEWSLIALSTNTWIC